MCRLWGLFWLQTTPPPLATHCRARSRRTGQPGTPQTGTTIHHTLSLLDLFLQDSCKMPFTQHSSRATNTPRRASPRSSSRAPLVSAPQHRTQIEQHRVGFKPCCCGAHARRTRQHAAWSPSNYQQLLRSGRLGSPAPRQTQHELPPPSAALCSAELLAVAAASQPPCRR